MWLWWGLLSKRPLSEAVAQLGNGCTEYSCSTQLLSNVRRCDHCWVIKSLNVPPGMVWKFSFRNNSSKAYRKPHAFICSFRNRRLLVTSPVSAGNLVCLTPQTKPQAFPNWNVNHYKWEDFLSNFRISSPT